MTSAAVEEWLNSSLGRITSQKFKECVKVEVVELKPLTDQLIVIVSDIFRVKIKLVYKNGDSAELKGVYKIEPTKPGFEKFVKETGICEAELLVYDKILRSMEELMSTKDEMKEIFWPECYYCGDNKFLLEDLCEEGYKIVPTHEMFDFKHATLALKVLGKYHALSLVLKEEGILDINKVPINLLIKKFPFINNLYAGNINQLADTIEESWDQDWKSVAEKLRDSIKNIDDKLANMVISSQGKCSVLIHGDYTIRNMLFKYDEKYQKTPVNIKILDFQGASWSNLAMDLVTLLYSSVLPQTRDENLDTFLRVYWESLTHWCSYFGYKGTAISLKDVQQCHDAFNFWGMLISLFVIPAFLGPQDNFFADSKEEIDEAAFKIIKPSSYKIKIIEDALKCQLKISLKQNVI